MQLNRGKIVDAALEILNQYGLADLTMRRLARHLEVAPGAMYWHFKSKQELIAGVAESIVHDVITQPHPTPQAWCTHFHHCLLAHRDGAELVAAAVALSPMHQRLLVGLMDSVEQAFPRLGASTIHNAAATILHYLLGSIVLEQSAVQAAEFSTKNNGKDSTTSSEAQVNVDAGVEIILAGLGTLS